MTHYHRGDPFRLSRDESRTAAILDRMAYALKVYVFRDGSGRRALLARHLPGKFIPLALPLRSKRTPLSRAGRLLWSRRPRRLVLRLRGGQPTGRCGR